MIRKATLSDVPSLTELSKVLGYTLPEKDFLSNLTAVLEGENCLFVAEIDSKVVGYIEGSIYRSILVTLGVRVMGIAVLPDFQDRGIGGELLEALENWARAKGLAQVSLTSGEQRHLAHDFYRKHGYEEYHKQLKFGKWL
ncbi:GNAT family N-acetyltransferase [Lactococcus nasutitermitis]|uniref:GNAT family N-acetyltransferase n=1 Tax=Lactococcus nasutitermitis TaxID=1652957 RepID=A0ABV9JGD8_9LACT|nr:GNAT family N-acetyltransferase [Lactococcus nasutitermitis]